MFEQAVLSSGPAAKRVWTTSLGLVGQAMLVGGAIVLTVLHPEALPIATILTRLEAPGPPPAPQPPGPRVKPEGQIRTTSAPILPTRPWEPSSIPRGVKRIVDALPESAEIGGVIGGIPVIGGSATAATSTLLTQFLTPTVAPPKTVENTRTVTTRTVTPEPTRIIRISSLQPARLIHKVEPIYPEMAKRMRVEGAVQVEAIVATDGHMRDLRVVSGHHLLIPAALEAVRQWIYQPTVLNGEKVEVSAPITVNFILNK